MLSSLTPIQQVTFAQADYTHRKETLFPLLVILGLGFFVLVGSHKSRGDVAGGPLSGSCSGLLDAGVIMTTNMICKCLQEGQKGLRSK